MKWRRWALIACAVVACALLVMRLTAESNTSQHAPEVEAPGTTVRGDGGTEISDSGEATDPPPADAQVPESHLTDGSAWTTVRKERGSMEQVATRLLRRYRDEGTCVLARSGYLDLSGAVWGCVIQGVGWTDVCVVSETREDRLSEVRVLRLTAEEVARQLGCEGDR